MPGKRNTYTHKNTTPTEPNNETLLAVKEAEEAERTHFINAKLYQNPRDVLKDLFDKK